MGWPQIALIAIMGINLGGSLVKASGKDGKPSELVTMLVAQGILAFLLIAGGFFAR